MVNICNLTVQKADPDDKLTASQGNTVSLRDDKMHDDLSGALSSGSAFPDRTCSFPAAVVTRGHKQGCKMSLIHI